MAVAVLNFEKFQYNSNWMKIFPPNVVDRYITASWNDWRYSDNIINNYKMAFSIHVFDRLSDDDNFWHSKRAVQENLVQLPIEQMSKYNCC